MVKIPESVLLVVCDKDVDIACVRVDWPKVRVVETPGVDVSNVVVVFCVLVVVETPGVDVSNVVVVFCVLVGVLCMPDVVIPPEAVVDAGRCVEGVVGGFEVRGWQSVW